MSLVVGTDGRLLHVDEPVAPERPLPEADRLVEHHGRVPALDRHPPHAAGRALLSLLIFYDGSRHPRCRGGGIFAAAERGGRIVWICPEPFVRLAWSDPGTAEVIVIHEALHSLGLGENPPTSDEITGRVRAACPR